jgi:DNA repair protein RadC
MMKQRVCDLPSSDKPRERLITQGGSALSDTELLAIILRSGGEDNSALQLSSQILKEFGGFKGIYRADIQQLVRYKDVGIAKAAGIKAACEIALRINSITDNELCVITKPADIFHLLKKELFNQTKEYLYLLSLDSRNKVISKDLISVGTVNETLIHPREVFRTALAKNAVSIALAHNHPSDDPTPSTEDIKVTGRIAGVGVEIGINLIDHVIICNSDFTSIKAMNLLASSQFRTEKKGGD